jgi:Na+/H+ antiporter NhaD/arsenite permease-like protein
LAHMFLITALFVIGYVTIAVERPLRLDKSSTALFLGCALWTILAATGIGGSQLLPRLTDHFAEIAAIAFFLMGAMTIVAVIDAHGGFEVITERIGETGLRALLWIVAGLSFILSAILDNLTTTIVMLTLIKKLVRRKESRLLFAGIVVVAANSGGAFSPIGDVTTTMLWIGGRISAETIILRLLMPSVVSLLIPLLAVTFWLKGGSVKEPGEPEAPRAEGDKESREGKRATDRERVFVFFLGVGLIIAVPVFRVLTGLPPYLGILFAVGVIWIVTEFLHRGKADHQRRWLTVGNALVAIDLPTVLFFVGILLAVAALEVCGVLGLLSEWLDAKIGNQSIIVMAIGIASSVIDNVPLVSATMNMYDLTRYPMDHFVWEFIAYCAGTGGSILIMGSAAGVAAMGIEKISFGWYARRFALVVLTGYFAGAGVYLLQRALLIG